jgi:PAS domain S-box-containing protein
MDHRLLYLNQAGRKLIGLEDADIGALKTDDLYFPEDLAVFRKQQEPNSWHGELRVKHFKTGVAIPVDRYHFFVMDRETGRPIARAAVMRDITDLKRIREERERYFQQLQDTTLSLKESEEKFRTLAVTTTAAIFIHQGQKLVYANPAAETMTGYSSEELLREDFWSLIHPDYQNLVRERGLARLRGETVPRDYEYKFIKKNGEECWVSMTAGFIEYAGSPAIIATLFDITEWKHAEEAKVRFYEESVRQYEERIDEEKRHLREKEKILMDLHDGIGGITTNISILSELALRASERERQAKLLATISRLAAEGISEIRSFMHSLDDKELNWATLATELRKQGTNMLETYNIDFSITKKIGEIAEQPGSLSWVNIFKIYKEALTNVIKHSKASEVSVSFSVDPDVVRLVIADNGVGVNGTTGNGRGLANMKMRAEDIGGTVTLTNHSGTRVSLYLPLPLKYPAGGMENL